MSGTYRTILADPPWPQEMGTRHKRRTKTVLPYPTMTVDDIKALPVCDLAEKGAHLWLWATNAFLPVGFEVMRAWGFRYMVAITWRKPSGQGIFWVHTTQHLLFGYKERCEFNRAKLQRTDFDARPQKHSRKPLESYQLIERVSDPARLELFARPLSPMWPKREGWHVWGNEVDSDIEIRG